eukprot:XP_012826579.1 PREDICTED: uncharacterized protein LOC100488700 isoform X28 [Xenopus tropicalis]
MKAIILLALLAAVLIQDISAAPVQPEGTEPKSPLHRRGCVIWSCFGKRDTDKPEANGEGEALVKPEETDISAAAVQPEGTDISEALEQPEETEPKSPLHRRGCVIWSCFGKRDTDKPEANGEGEALVKPEETDISAAPVQPEGTDISEALEQPEETEPKSLLQRRGCVIWSCFGKRDTDKPEANGEGEALVKPEETDISAAPVQPEGTDISAAPVQPEGTDISEALEQPEGTEHKSLLHRRGCVIWSCFGKRDTDKPEANVEGEALVKPDETDISAAPVQPEGTDISAAPVQPEGTDISEALEQPEGTERKSLLHRRGYCVFWFCVGKRDTDTPEANGEGEALVKPEETDISAAAVQPEGTDISEALEQPEGTEHKSRLHRRECLFINCLKKRDTEANERKIRRPVRSLAN